MSLRGFEFAACGYSIQSGRRCHRGRPEQSKVTVTFNQPVQIAGMGSPGNFSLKTTSGEGAAVAADISYDSTASTATLTPLSPLAPSTTYRVMVSGIENAAGTPMSSPTTWTFTTASTRDRPKP